MTELAIEASGLRKSFRGVTVLADVDLQVEQGSVFALLGPNGAGKTTIMRILATLLRADSGQARVAGFDVVREQQSVRRVISLTGQYPTVDDLQTGEENLRMMGRLSGVSREGARRRAAELLAQFDLADAGHRRVATYSGGMRRRLDLAASLVTSPLVIFLDEPTTGLDLRSRQTMWQVILDLADSGVTVFLTTQYLEEADQMASRIAVIDGGHVVADGTPMQLKDQVAAHRLALLLVDADAFDQAARVLGSRVTFSGRDQLTLGVATDGSAADVRALLNEVDPEYRTVRSFTVHSASIDDVFLALTGRVSGRTQEVATGA